MSASSSHYLTPGKLGGPCRPGPTLDTKPPGPRRLRQRSYAVASLSCTLAISLSVVGGAVGTRTASQLVITFVAYGWYGFGRNTLPVAVGVIVILLFGYVVDQRRRRGEEVQPGEPQSTHSE